MANSIDPFSGLGETERLRAVLQLQLVTIGHDAENFCPDNLVELISSKLIILMGIWLPCFALVFT